MGLLMGVEGYKNRYNVNVAANVDLIVTFRDDIAAFKSNCGSQGPGVYCTNNKSRFKISLVHFKPPSTFYKLSQILRAYSKTIKSSLKPRSMPFLMKSIQGQFLNRDLLRS